LPTEENPADNEDLKEKNIAFYDNLMTMAGLFSEKQRIMRTTFEESNV